MKHDFRAKKNLLSTFNNEVGWNLFNSPGASTASKSRFFYLFQNIFSASPECSAIFCSASKKFSLPLKMVWLLLSVLTSCMLEVWLSNLEAISHLIKIVSWDEVFLSGDLSFCFTRVMRFYLSVYGKKCSWFLFLLTFYFFVHVWPNSTLTAWLSSFRHDSQYQSPIVAVLDDYIQLESHFKSHTFLLLDCTAIFLWILGAYSLFWIFRWIWCL